MKNQDERTNLKPKGHYIKRAKSGRFNTNLASVANSNTEEDVSLPLIKPKATNQVEAEFISTGRGRLKPFPTEETN